MMDDGIIQRVVAEIAATEKQAVAQSEKVNSLPATDYGSEMQFYMYERLLDVEMELRKLKTKHQRLLGETDS